MEDEKATGTKLDDAKLEKVVGGTGAPLDRLDWDPNGCPECGGEMQWIETAVKRCANCGYLK